MNIINLFNINSRTVSCRLVHEVLGEKFMLPGSPRLRLVKNLAFCRFEVLGWKRFGEYSGENNVLRRFNRFF